MRRFTILTLTVFTVAAFACDVQAGCKGRRGGHGYGRPSYHRPYYHNPPVHRPHVHYTVVRPAPLPPTSVQLLPPGQPAPPANVPAQPPTQQQPPQQPAPVAGTPSPSTATNPEMNALQLLGGTTESTSAAPAAPAAPSPAPALWGTGTETSQSAAHVGTWTASLPNQAQVQLQLEADGRFSWLAKSNGKQSRFDGQFKVDGDTLTLTRSSDSQKLSGKLTFGGNGFNFKLVGAKDSGLNFSPQS